MRAHCKTCGVRPRHEPTRRQLERAANTLIGVAYGDGDDPARRLSVMMGYLEEMERVGVVAFLKSKS